MIDIFSSFLAPLEHELMSRSSYSVGKSHSISHNTNYMERIEAVNFALDNDDGARTRYYDKADLILVGVSAAARRQPACTWRCSTASAPPTTRSPRTTWSACSCPVPSRSTGQAVRSHHRPGPPGCHPQRTQAQQPLRQFRPMRIRSARSGKPVPPREHQLHQLHAFSVEEISAKILVEKGVERRLK